MIIFKLNKIFFCLFELLELVCGFELEMDFFFSSSFLSELFLSDQFPTLYASVDWWMGRQKCMDPHNSTLTPPNDLRQRVDGAGCR